MNKDFKTFNGKLWYLIKNDAVYVVMYYILHYFSTFQMVRRGKSFRESSTFPGNLLVSDDFVVACVSCFNILVFQVHIERVHNVQNKKFCMVCNSSFTSLKALNKHINNKHADWHTCETEGCGHRHPKRPRHD